MYKRSRVNVKVEPRSTFTFYAWPFIHYFYARKNYATVSTLNSVQQSKQRINQIETEDMELNNYMCIFPLFGEVRERHSSVYVLVQDIYPGWSAVLKNTALTLQ